MVEESVEQVAAVSCSERAVAPGIGEAGEVWPPQAAVERGPTTLGEAVRWIEEEQMVPMKRMSGNRLTQSFSGHSLHGHHLLQRC